MSVHRRRRWLSVTSGRPKTPRNCFSHNWPNTRTPRTNQHYERIFFLGLCHVFQQFVSNFAPRVVALLNKKRQKNQPTKFGPLSEEELAAMNALKEALVSRPVPAMLNFTGHMTMDTDACNKQVACVLLQTPEDDSTRPVEYGSCISCDAGRRHDSTQRECLAIGWSILILQSYLDGTRFTIWTDQDFLK